MPSNRIALNLDEMRAGLRAMPVRFRDDGAEIVETAARWAHNEVKSEYNQHRVTGNLADHVKLEIEHNEFGSRADVKSTAKHAHIFEDGSAVRKTKKGANRGSMPPGNIFVPIVVRRRRWMNDQLVAMLERAGLVVSGTP